MKINLIFIVFILLFSCSKPKVRKPITHHSSISYFEESIALNKEIIKYEEQLFKNIIKNDTLHSYKSSPNGFWYYYDKKVKGKAISPKSNDLVIIHYEIKNIDNEVILKKEQLGTKGQKSRADRLLKVDKENFISGLHDGVKLMKVGEQVTFLMPSNKAFGATGLQQFIGANEPLIIKVELIKILNN